MRKSVRRPVVKTLLFALPYLLTQFINTIFVVIDQSISNSIGETALVVFSSFITLNWAINTLMWSLSSGYSIVLSRNKKDDCDINTTGISLELVLNLVISLILFVFAEQITHIYQLSDAARNILAVILRLKAIQLPLSAAGIIMENNLKIKERIRAVFIIMMTASAVNIAGDFLSVWAGFNEVGIYWATVISTALSTILFFIVSKFRLGKFRKNYAKEMLSYTKDLFLNRIIQRFVNITYTSIASSLGTVVYTIHCACITVVDVLEDVVDVNDGFLIDYANHIAAKGKNLLRKVDGVAVVSGFFALGFLLIVTFPAWWLLGRVVPWEDCNPYIWFYVMDFVCVTISGNYVAYLSANKFTGPIRKMALIGGVLVRLPLTFLFRELGMGLWGLAIACPIDRAIRVLYIRLSIYRNRKRLCT